MNSKTKAVKLDFEAFTALDPILADKIVRSNNVNWDRLSRPKPIPDDKIDWAKVNWGGLSKPTPFPDDKIDWAKFNWDGLIGRRYGMGHKT